jgi:hypothetical protein
MYVLPPSSGQKSNSNQKNYELLLAPKSAILRAATYRLQTASRPGYSNWNGLKISESNERIASPLEMFIHGLVSTSLLIQVGPNFLPLAHAVTALGRNLRTIDSRVDCFPSPPLPSVYALYRLKDSEHSR